MWWKEEGKVKLKRKLKAKVLKQNLVDLNARGEGTYSSEIP